MVCVCVCVCVCVYAPMYVKIIRKSGIGLRINIFFYDALLTGFVFNTIQVRIIIYIKYKNNLIYA